MAVILAYIMVFIIGINILESSGVFGMLPCETASAALKGIFEMTIGVNLIGMCNTGIRIKTVICAFPGLFRRPVRGRPGRVRSRRIVHGTWGHIENKADPWAHRCSYRYDIRLVCVIISI